MSYKTIYVVLYKEEITSNGITETQNGICEWGYTNENEAINKVNELITEKLKEFNNDCIHDKNDSGDWQKITVNTEDKNEEYEYSVQNVAVPAD